MQRQIMNLLRILSMEELGGEARISTDGQTITIQYLKIHDDAVNNLLKQLAQHHDIFVSFSPDNSGYVELKSGIRAILAGEEVPEIKQSKKEGSVKIKVWPVSSPDQIELDLETKRDQINVDWTELGIDDAEERESLEATLEKFWRNYHHGIILREGGTFLLPHEIVTAVEEEGLRVFKGSLQTKSISDKMTNHSGVPAALNIKTGQPLAQHLKDEPRKKKTEIAVLVQNSTTNSAHWLFAATSQGENLLHAIRCDEQLSFLGTFRMLKE